jgi:hypothetical protein
MEFTGTRRQYVQQSGAGIGPQLIQRAIVKRQGKLIGIQHGVSKREEDVCSPPALSATTSTTGHPRNGCKAISGVARPQGIERWSIADPGETVGSPWPPLPICIWKLEEFKTAMQMQTM